mgnify:CR=1 FL=1
MIALADTPSSALKERPMLGALSFLQSSLQS